MLLVEIKTNIPHVSMKYLLESIALIYPTLPGDADVELPVYVAVMALYWKI